MTAEISQEPEQGLVSQEPAEHLVPPAVDPRPVSGRAAQQVTLRRTEEYRGHQSISPLPPASELEALEKIQPGSTERLFKLIESEQQHRHSLDNNTQSTVKRITKGDYLLARRGQKYALVVSLGALLLAGLIAFVTKNPWVPGGIVAIDLAAIVTAFIVGTNRLRDEEEQENQNEESPGEKSR